MVGAELDLVAVGSKAGQLGHDAGIAEKDVQAGGLREELLGGFVDGG